jgi:hypothetical protein
MTDARTRARKGSAEMTNAWHRLGLFQGLMLIALSGWGCGGRSASDEGEGGNGAAAGSGGNAGHGGSTGGSSTGGHANGGSSTSGGRMPTTGGATYGGATYGGAAYGGATYGGATYGGAAYGGATYGGATYGGAAYGGATYGGAAYGGSAAGGAAPQPWCDYNGQRFSLGASFLAVDGCNTCTCSKTGGVQCSMRPCAVCSMIDEAHYKAVEEARRCNPTLDRLQCTALIDSGLTCGCPSYVNSEAATALVQVKELQLKWAGAQCGGNVTCGACAEVVGAYCSSAGRCEDLYGQGLRACKVGGVIYPSGTGNIPDPSSCNSCFCGDGELSCSQAFCASTCPPGTAFGTQCSVCSATTGCILPDYECLPTCTDACADPTQSCVNGVCTTNSCPVLI